MNLAQVLQQSKLAPASPPEIGPDDILAATQQGSDHRLRCPKCGKGLYLEVERRDTGVIPYGAGEDLEFDPDDSDGGETTIVSVYCPCGWAYPDAPEHMFATTIGYGTVLAWETDKDSLCEMLTDVAYAQWAKARPDEAAQHADTYQAHVAPTPSGYRVTLTALEWEVATPEAAPAILAVADFYVTAGADPNYPLDVWECARDATEPVAVLINGYTDWNAIRQDFPEVQAATRDGAFIVAPNGKRYRCTGM